MLKNRNPGAARSHSPCPSAPGTSLWATSSELRLRRRLKGFPQYYPELASTVSSPPQLLTTSSIARSHRFPSACLATTLPHCVPPPSDDCLTPHGGVRVGDPPQEHTLVL